MKIYVIRYKKYDSSAYISDLCRLYIDEEKIVAANLFRTVVEFRFSTLHYLTMPKEFDCPGIRIFDKDNDYVFYLRKKNLEKVLSILRDKKNLEEREA